MLVPCLVDATHAHCQRNCDLGQSFGQGGGRSEGEEQVSGRRSEENKDYEIQEDLKGNESLVRADERMGLGGYRT